jgi:hypothetical protein
MYEQSLFNKDEYKNSDCKYESHKNNYKGSDHKCKCQTHVHEYLGSTRIAEAKEYPHNHRFAGVTGEAIPRGNSHVHQLLGNTDFYESHHHEVGATTGSAIPVGGGSMYTLFMAKPLVMTAMCTNLSLLQ